MADSILPVPAGLSGHSVRGVVEAGTNSDTMGNTQNIGDVVQHACDIVYHALDLTGQAMGQAVDKVSDKVFENAANVGVNIATPPTQTLGQTSFSWSGYIQAIGILCLLLAALWFAVWCIRRFGKFNFLPRPGSLPRDALVMETQMPLGPRKGLMVVRFLNRRLLLGVTEHQISLLTEEKAGDERHAKDFQGFMEDMRNASDNSGIDHTTS